MMHIKNIINKPFPLGHEYKITRHYTCESTNIVYLAKCCLCSVDYIDQSTRSIWVIEVKSGQEQMDLEITSWRIMVRVLTLKMKYFLKKM